MGGQGIVHRKMRIRDKALRLHFMHFQLLIVGGAT